MSDCKIVKNKNGKINGVLDQSGNPSTLFKEILNVPTLNLNEAIELYKNIYSEQFKDTVKFQILGEKGAKNLDQIEEVTYRMDNLLVAREMEKVGKTAKEIRLATGWERGADSLWRYEILDGIESNIQIGFNKKNETFTDTNIATTLLPELYSNQELYNAYPTLKKTPIIFYNDTSFFGELSGFTWQGRIFLNSKKFIDGQNRYRTDLSNKNDRFTLQHEVQHILQDIEGFDRGTSAKTQEEKIKESLDYIRDNKGKTRNSYDEFLKNYLSKDVNFFNRLLLKTLPIDKVASILSQKFYLLKAGEVEARNVQLRANLTAQERLEKPLFETQQVPYDKQLVDVSEQDKNFIMANLTSPQNKTKKQQIQEQLKLTGLAKNVYNLSNAEIETKLIELGVDANIAKQVVAYHGSPYSFDRFTTNAMGTGEGVQAFGWGLYFTDLDSIAKNYAKKLANYKKAVDELNTTDEVKAIVLADLENYGNDIDEMIKDVSSLVKSEKDVKLKELFTEVLKQYRLLKPNRNLYKVSLHKGKEVGDYTWLEWDKEVSKNIVKNIRNLEKELFEIIGTDLDSSGNKIDIIEGSYGKNTEGTYDRFESEDNGKFIDWLGQNVYQNIDNILFDSRKASMLLLKNGIDGIKYPAESISRGTTSDTTRGFNYVVFDENAITIEEQIQFQKQLSEKGIGLTTAGFTFNEKYNPTKILNLMVKKGQIEKICK
jgi:hypothetical protein